MQFLEEEILEITETTMAVDVGLGYSPSSLTGLNGSCQRVFHRESGNIRGLDWSGVIA